MNDKKFIPFWMEKSKEEIIEAYIECIHNGEVLLNRIDKAIKYIGENCILCNEWEETEFCQFIPKDKITYKELNKTKVINLLNILRGEDNE